MDLNIAVTFDGRNGLAFTQGEDRTFLLGCINRTDGSPIDITGATVAVHFPAASGGAVKRSSGPMTLRATDVTGSSVFRRGHGLVTGDPVTLSGAALPAPLAEDTGYLVAVTDADTFGFTDTNGTAIALTTSGSGTFALQNPEDVVVSNPTAGLATLSLRAAVTAAIAAGIAQDFQVAITSAVGRIRVVVEKSSLDVTVQPEP